MKPEDNQIPVADVAGELIRVALWLSTEHRNNIARHGEQAKVWHEQIFGLCQCAAMEVAGALMALPETEGDAGRYLEGDVSWLAYLSGLQKRYCGGIATVRADDPEAVAAAIEEIARAIAAGSEKTDAAKPPDDDQLKSDPLSKAILLIKRNPALTNAQIAATVGVHIKTLNKSTWEPFRKMRELMRNNAPPPTGSKSKDGDIDAWETE